MARRAGNLSGQPSRDDRIITMSRQLVLGIAAAVALGAATLAAAPASAQSWSLSIGSGHSDHYQGGYRHDRPRNWGNHRFEGNRFHERRIQRDGWHSGGWNSGWGHRQALNHGYGYGQRCAVRQVRYFDGWSWIVERRRVCG
jgi:hypothetical protein